MRSFDARVLELGNEFTESEQRKDFVNLGRGQLVLQYLIIEAAEAFLGQHQAREKGFATAMGQPMKRRVRVVSEVAFEVRTRLDRSC